MSVTISSPARIPATRGHDIDHAADRVADARDAKPSWLWRLVEASPMPAPRSTPPRPWPPSASPAFGTRSWEVPDPRFRSGVGWPRLCDVETREVRPL